MKIFNFNEFDNYALNCSCGEKLNIDDKYVKISEKEICFLSIGCSFIYDKITSEKISGPSYGVFANLTKYCDVCSIEYIFSIQCDNSMCNKHVVERAFEIGDFLVQRSANGNVEVIKDGITKFNFKYMSFFDKNFDLMKLKAKINNLLILR